MRNESRAAQKSKSYEIMDVNNEAIESLFDTTGASMLIHGHTHRPATHVHASGTRHVLPDWDCDVEPPRGGWLELDADARILRRGLDDIYK
jgi:UDP-2,3-diacylglucosamine hydrolase